YREFAGFCMPMEEAAERFDESLAVILKAWTSDAPWSHRGKYWQFEEVVVEPPTAQKPHPPLWMGAGSPESITKVAEQGHQLLLDQYASIEEIGERIALFKSEVEKRGRAFDPMSVAVTRSINVVGTSAELQKAFETRIAARRRIDRLTLRPDGTNQKRVISDEAICAGALYGTPDALEVAASKPRQLLGEHRHALPIRARHAGDVGAPERAVRPERLEDLAEMAVDVPVRVGLARIARRARHLDRDVGEPGEREHVRKI